LNFLGVRLCLGESFARNSAFQIFAALIQNYKLEVPTDGNPPEDKKLPGITAAPEPFDVKVVKL
jgi:cytochrome P450